MSNQAVKNDYITRLAKSIIANKVEIAGQIVSMRSQDIDTENDFFTEESLLSRALDLIQLIGDYLDKDIEHDIGEIVSWGAEKGKQAVVVEAPISESLRTTPYYRKVLWSYVAEFAEEEDLSLDKIIVIANRLDVILDQAVYGYSKSFVEYNIEIAAKYHEAVLELSVPVVPLFDGVAVLPIIGEVDTNRAKLIQDRAIERCEELKLDRIIIDLSGVAVVDTMVANHLFQLVKTLRLLGVKSLFTGIRSAVAITAVNLGIELKDMNIYTTLQQALDALGYGKVREETIY
ncbi:STAS domain-containing protein [Pseudalkalibacillus sp. SCS-8]|uniref:STAS domain-containing protein n=1 Tax=Pseudalkalibacillus nanhaiensis TaxID=3115291 RepID=UPI0032DB8D36